jgi:hypothetical protein
MRGLAGVDAGTTAIVSQLGLLDPSVRVTVQVSNPGSICAGHCTGQLPRIYLCGSLYRSVIQDLSVQVTIQVS